MNNHDPTDLSPPLPQSILMGYMPDERGIVRTVFGYTERDLRVYADWYAAALRTALEALRAKHETQTKYLLQMQEAAKDLVWVEVLEALRNLAHHAERANEIALRELGIGVCDVNAISAARAAVAKVEKEPGNG